MEINDNTIKGKEDMKEVNMYGKGSGNDPTQMQGKANYVFWDIFTRSDSRCGITMTDCKTHENWLKFTTYTQIYFNFNSIIMEKFVIFSLLILGIIFSGKVFFLFF